MYIWESFRKEKIIKIFNEKHSIIDIGGGLRASKEKGNVYHDDHEWLTPYMEKVDYKILDPVPDYHPDIIGDIHKLPFDDNSVDAIICIAVLEHVENPIQACKEMHRVLKPGGYCFSYIPFIYPYHALEGYYKDFWRMTKDGIDYTFRHFQHIEKQGVRTPSTTLINMTPFHALRPLLAIGSWFDHITHRTNSAQVSGYYVFSIK